MLSAGDELLSQPGDVLDPSGKLPLQRIARAPQCIVFFRELGLNGFGALAIFLMGAAVGDRRGHLTRDELAEAVIAVVEPQVRTDAEHKNPAAGRGIVEGIGNTTADFGGSGQGPDGMLKILPERFSTICIVSDCSTSARGQSCGLEGWSNKFNDERSVRFRFSKPGSACESSTSSIIMKQVEQRERNVFWLS